MTERKYLPTLSELVDRLSIAQLKEVFISEHKDEYAQEIEDICHDIQLILNKKGQKIWFNYLLMAVGLCGLFWEFSLSV